MKKTFDKNIRSEQKCFSVGFITDEESLIDSFRETAVVKEQEGRDDGLENPGSYSLCRR